MINDELVNEVIEDFLKKYGEENRYILADIDKQIAKLYAKYAKDNGLTYLDALKYLTDNERAEFQHDLKYYLESIADKEFYETHKAELQALSVRARVKRLDLMKANISMSLSKMFNSLLDQSKGTLKTVYKAGKIISETEAEAVKNGELKIVATGNNRISEDGVILSTQKIKESAWSETDDRLLQTLEEFPWSGENYSEKIWGNKEELEKALNNELTHGLVTGKPYDEIVSDMQKKLDAEQWKIERLVRTEGTFIANQASLRGYEEAGIKHYRYVARLDSRTSPMCRELNGKVFEVAKAVAGENLPPMHPWCRSTTVPIFDKVDKKGVKEYNIDEIEEKLFDQTHKFSTNEEAGNAAFYYAKNKSLELNSGRQDIHLFGTKNTNLSRTIIVGSNNESPEQLKEILFEIYNNYRGTGRMEISDNRWINKEIIELSKEDINKYNLSFNDKGITGKITKFKIHYGREKVHLVPYKK